MNLAQRQELSILGTGHESPADFHKRYIDSLKDTDQHDHRSLFAIARS
jgi:hypothetical protein